MALSSQKQPPTFGQSKPSDAFTMLSSSGAFPNDLGLVHGHNSPPLFSHVNAARMGSEVQHIVQLQEPREVDLWPFILNQVHFTHATEHHGFEVHEAAVLHTSIHILGFEKCTFLVVE